jgi:hypothetical protein
MLSGLTNTNSAPAGAAILPELPETLRLQVLAELTKLRAPKRLTEASLSRPSAGLWLYREEKAFREELKC